MFPLNLKSKCEVKSGGSINLHIRRTCALLWSPGKWRSVGPGIEESRSHNTASLPSSKSLFGIFISDSAGCFVRHSLAVTLSAAVKFQSPSQFRQNNNQVIHDLSANGTRSFAFSESYIQFRRDLAPGVRSSSCT